MIDVFLVKYFVRYRTMIVKKVIEYNTQYYELAVFIQHINISYLLEMNWCRCIGKRFAFVFIHCCQIFEKQFSYNVFILFLRKIQNFSAKIVMDVKPTTRVHW